MRKAKKQREIVEAHLRSINECLAYAEENDCIEAVKILKSQKLEVEYILRDFDKI